MLVVNIMSSPSTAQYILRITDIFVVYASAFILVIGLVGNCLNIIVFTTLRTLRSKPCGFYFFIESIVDLGQLLFALLAYIIEGFGINTSTNSVIWCKIKTTGIQSFNMIFLVTVCLAAFDQFLSTHYLYSLRQMSTKKFAQNLLLSSLSIIILHTILSLIFYDLRSLVFGCIIYNPIVTKYYGFFYIPVLIGILPVIITVTCSLIAFYNVRHLVRRQIPIERRIFDRQLTAMTFARVIAYICLGLPYVIFRIYQIQMPITIDNSLKFAIDYMLGSLTGTVAYINYVVRTFFCYYYSAC